MNVTFAFPSIVKTGPVSHVTIILLPNVPTLSNVIELWSELGSRPLLRTNPQTREDTARWRGPNDLLLRSYCDEKVARGEPGRRGLRWSESHVFFHQPTGRKHPEERAIPVAVDLSTMSVFVLAHVKVIRVNSRAYGPGDALAWHDKDTWIGGVKHSCER